MKPVSILFFLLAVLIFQHSRLRAQDQKTSDHDTSYYKSYADRMLYRFYFSRKYTSFEVGSSDNNKDDLRYRPNSTLNMGVGATYKSISLNLAYGFPFLNRNEEKGKTKYLDLQSHAYTRKWTYDLWGQFYKGYYVRRSELDGSDGYYIRPDMRVDVLGLSAYKILQHDKFSYRAAFVQNEWQIKSAGSLLVGAEIYYGRAKADSAIVPGVVKDRFNQRDIDRVRYLDIGPGVGYAYNWVVKKHFFLGMAATMNLNIGFVKESTANMEQHKVGISPDFIYRATTGYNSSNWTANVSLVGNRVSVRGASSAQNYIVRSGNYRATVAYRFKPGRKLKKYLKPLDEMGE